MFEEMWLDLLMKMDVIVWNVFFDSYCCNGCVVDVKCMFFKMKEDRYFFYF